MNGILINLMNFERRKDRTNSIQQRITSVDDVPARSRGARSVSVARVPLLPANHIRQNAHLYLDPPDRAHSLPCHDPLYRRPIVIDVLEIELELTLVIQREKFRP